MLALPWRLHCRSAATLALQKPPTYLQKASSAPRSLQGVQRVPMCRLPGVGLVQCLLGNLWAEYSFPKSWTSPAWGLDIERRALWPGP